MQRLYWQAAAWKIFQVIVYTIFLKDENQCHKVRELIEKGENIDELEVKFEAQENDTRFCLLSLTFIDNAEEQTLIHGILHDITNIRKAEVLNIQAEKLAANERLIRMLAHEIRNPLNNIKSFDREPATRLS